MFKLVATLAALFFAAPAVVQGSPSKRATLDVWSPTITAPASGDVWSVGTIQEVKWDLEGIPESAWNSSGSIYLGYYLTDGSDSEHLDYQHPLAKGFTYGDCQANVTVPDVQTRDTYIIILLGDSGNTSANFTITNPSA